MGRSSVQSPELLRLIPQQFDGRGDSPMAHSCSLACADEEPGPYFSELLYDAIAHQSLTLDQIEEKLDALGTPLSRTSLSYWKNGHSEPTREESLRAVVALEEVLHLPAGHLVATLDLGRRSDADLLADEQCRTAEVDLRERGFLLQQGHVNEYLRDSLTTSGDRTLRWENTEQMVCARRDGLDRVAILCGRGPGGSHPSTVEAIGGCAVGDVVMLEEQDLLAVELLLPRSLSAGERHLLEYRVTRPTDPDEAESTFIRMLPGRLNYLVLELGTVGEPVTSPLLFRRAPGTRRPDGTRRTRPGAGCRHPRPGESVQPDSRAARPRLAPLRCRRTARTPDSSRPHDTSWTTTWTSSPPASRTPSRVRARRWRSWPCNSRSWKAR